MDHLIREWTLNRVKRVVGHDAVELFRSAVGEPDPWQVQLLCSSSTRVLLNASRQAGKSQVVACLAVSHAVAHSGSLTLIVSPSQRQSQETFIKCLQIYRSTLQHVAPSDAETLLRLELANGSRILSLPGHTDRNIRGFSKPGLILVDEAARVGDEIFLSVLPMLAISQGKLIALSTPWGKRGWFYEAWQGKGEWERFEVPASACPRISAQFLEEQQRLMPRLAFASEYQCEFCDVDDQVFLTEDINRMLVDKPIEVGWWS